MADLYKEGRECCRVGAAKWEKGVRWKSGENGERFWGWKSRENIRASAGTRAAGEKAIKICALPLGLIAGKKPSYFTFVFLIPPQVHLINPLSKSRVYNYFEQSLFHLTRKDLKEQICLRLPYRSLYETSYHPFLLTLPTFISKDFVISGSPEFCFCFLLVLLS